MWKSSKRVITIVGLILILLMTQVGCKESSSREEIYIYAAASLTESFLAIETTYEALHPEINIVFNFAGSQILANQITEGGAPAMFFSANTKYIDLISDNETIKSKDKSIFARNSLVIIVNNQFSNTGIEKFEDLFGALQSNPPDLSIVLAHDEVPVGSYTENMLIAYKENTQDFQGYDNFLDHVVSYENDVKAVLAKVTMNAADMGLVYKSDALSVKEDTCYMIEIPEMYNQIAEYGAIRLSNHKEAVSLYDYITKGEGQGILSEYGLE